MCRPRVVHWILLPTSTLYISISTFDSSSQSSIPHRSTMAVVFCTTKPFPYRSPRNTMTTRRYRRALNLECAVAMPLRAYTSLYIARYHPKKPQCCVMERQDRVDSVPPSLTRCEATSLWKGILYCLLTEMLYSKPVDERRNTEPACLQPPPTPMQRSETTGSTPRIAITICRVFDRHKTRCCQLPHLISINHSRRIEVGGGWLASQGRRSAKKSPQTQDLTWNLSLLAPDHPSTDYNISGGQRKHVYIYIPRNDVHGACSTTTNKNSRECVWSSSLFPLYQ